MGVNSLAGGDALVLFSATSYSGTFASITPATPGTGLLWNTSTLASDGTLRVANAINLTPATITTTVSGNNLILSWLADHTGWRLQSQTNAPGVGLTTNWVDVAGSTLTNQVTIPINPASGSVFFRMIYP